MSTLVLKLGAAGDVVRTTPLLQVLGPDVSWLTSDTNLALVAGLECEAIPWRERGRVRGRRFDLVINLEDSDEAADMLGEVAAKRIFGAYRASGGGLAYSDDSAEWFDMSLISRFGRERADALKLANRRTYQEMLFEGLGHAFTGEVYRLPPTGPTDLGGDVAMAPRAGAVWPNKNWAGFEELRGRLQRAGLRVNVLPERPTLGGHLADVRNHRCLVSGDSLPMHLALGSGVPAVTIFTCTSPWEIHGYGIQRQIVSPLLAEYFYRRDFDPEATTAVTVDEVFENVMEAVGAPAS